MSGPHVAGAAALMHNRNRAEGLDLGAADLAALLMNYARPVVFAGSGDGKVTVPIARQGSGSLDVWRAARGKLLVRAGDIASIYLGAASLTRPERLARTLTVHNLTSELLVVSLDSRQLYDNDVDRGLRVLVPQTPVPIPAFGEAKVTVHFELDPAAMRQWSVRPDGTASTALVTAHELDGYITLTPLRGGEPDPDTPTASVPFYVLPRPASMVHTRGLPAIGDDDAGNMVFTNRSAYTGTVEIFVSPTGDNGVPADEDPDEPEVLHELDIRRVGVRIEPPTEEVTRTMLTFAMARHEVAPIPQVTRLEFYLDIDDDGATDFRVREGSQRGSMLTYWGRWDPDARAIVGGEYITDTMHSTDLYTHVSMLSVPLERLGMSEPQPFSFYVRNIGTTEDWLGAARVDLAPDGASEASGPRYHFAPEGWAQMPAEWTVLVPGRGSAAVPLTTAGKEGVELLALYPDNRFEESEGQLQVLPYGVMEPRVWPVWLPMTVRAGTR
jgi:hypothetical protein